MKAGWGLEENYFQKIILHHNEAVIKDLPIDHLNQRLKHLDHLAVKGK